MVHYVIDFYGLAEVFTSYQSTSEKLRRFVHPHVAFEDGTHLCNFCKLIFASVRGCVCSRSSELSPVVHIDSPSDTRSWSRQTSVCCWAFSSTANCANRCCSYNQSDYTAKDNYNGQYSDSWSSNMLLLLFLEAPMELNNTRIHIYSHSNDSIWMIWPMIILKIPRSTSLYSFLWLKHSFCLFGWPKSHGIPYSQRGMYFSHSLCVYLWCQSNPNEIWVSEWSHSSVSTYVYAISFISIVTNYMSNL